MRTFKSTLLILGSFGLLFLGSCSGGTQTSTSPENSNNTTKTNEVASSTAPEATKEDKKDAHDGEDGQNHSSTGDHGHDSDQGHSHESKEAQEVEQGKYHLELVTDKEDNGTHLDFSLHKGSDQSISNANVIAQVQLPDGKQQQIELKYDEQNKHYTGILADSVAGQHQVKITADVNGEKVSGRFQFDQQ